MVQFNYSLVTSASCIREEENGLFLDTSIAKSSSYFLPREMEERGMSGSSITTRLLKSQRPPLQILGILVQFCKLKIQLKSIFKSIFLSIFNSTLRYNKRLPIGRNNVVSSSYQMALLVYTIFRMFNYITNPFYIIMSCYNAVVI